MSATMTEAQKAYEARRAHKHGLSLEDWLAAKRTGSAHPPQAGPAAARRSSAPSERAPASGLPTVEQIRLLFSAPDFNSGAFFEQQGCVESLRHNGNRLTGTVRDQRGDRFHVDVEMTARDGQRRLIGGCTCRGRTACAHMAAILLAGVHRQQAAYATKQQSRARASGQPEAESPRQASQALPTPVPTAPHPVTAWLTEMQANVALQGAAAVRTETLPWSGAVERPIADAPAAGEPGSHVVFYFLSQGPRPGNRSVPAFGAALARIRKDGTPGAEREFSIWSLPTVAARHGLDADAEIGLLIEKLSGRPRLETDALRRTLLALYERILATGRCHWLDRSGVRLFPGPARSLPLAWWPDPEGKLALCVNPPSPETVIIGGDAQMYVDTADGSVGPVTVGVSAELTRLLLTGPLVPPGRRGEVMAGLGQIDTSLPTPLPVPPPPKRIRKDRRRPSAIPILRLLTAPLQTGAAPTDHVRLTFRYDGTEIDHRVRARQFDRLETDRLITVVRDLDAEAAAERALTDLGLKRVEASGRGAAYRQAGRRTGVGWSAFVFRGLPALAEQGWVIVIDDSFSHRVVDGGGTWLARMAPGEDDGARATGDGDGAVETEASDFGPGAWLSLSLDIEVDGERLPLLPILVHALRRIEDFGPGGAGSGSDAAAGLDRFIDGETAYLDLPDGRTVALPAARLRTFLNVLVELYEPGALDDQGRFRLPASQAAGLAALEDAVKLRWFGSGAVQNLMDRLRSFQGLAPMDPPTGFLATLRPYQRLGLAWLQFLRDFGFGGVLADDMGLGKTPQTLAHILMEKQAGRLDRPCLVVCPTSLVGNWLAEAARFCPDLSVRALHGPARADHFDALAGTDLVITTYPLLHRDEAVLVRQDWHLVILDEAQAIKNPKAKATLVACRLRTRHRLCLTGTPIENHLTELWSQFAFLMPGLLGKHRRFRSLFRTPIEKQNDADRLTGLQTRLRPFILRRTKAEVAADLPDKTEILRSVALTDAQRDLYETLRLSLHEKVQEEVRKKGLARSHIIILDALLKLRQVCCDPRLVKLETARRTSESAKLDHLMEMLPNLLEAGRRVLLFSQFTQMLDLIQVAVAEAEIPYVELRGDTNDRVTPVRRFQAGEVPLFLISLKAGGTGLNLTAADTVIHYDPWWNPAAERQATDRAHRIGQDKGVFVYKLIAAGTIEERILTLQAQKQKIADGLFADGAVGSGALKPEDLQFLFDPLG